MTEAGNKRSSEGENNFGGKKAKGDHLTLRFLLYSKHAGGIIGKGGETIKRLRSENSAQVFVPDGTTNERVLSIGAEKDNSINVFRQCLPLMHEPPYAVSSGPTEKESLEVCEVDFLVHSSQVGGIIGKSGARIKQIRVETNAGIKVYPDCLPGCKERVVAIRGEPEQIVVALEEILQTMREQTIKGGVILYDPSINDAGNSNDMPEMLGGSMASGNQIGGGPPEDKMRGHVGSFAPGGSVGFCGGSQSVYSGLSQNSGNNYGNDNNFSNSYSNQIPRGDGGGMGNNSNYSDGSVGGNQGSTTTSTQVTIPNDMAGAIIGQGGKRIQEIRQKCGAQIKFADPEPGKKDRLITISGTDEQIQYAQYFMQQCVFNNQHT